METYYLLLTSNIERNYNTIYILVVHTKNRIKVPTRYIPPNAPPLTSSKELIAATPLIKSEKSTRLSYLKLILIDDFPF